MLHWVMFGEKFSFAITGINYILNNNIQYGTGILCISEQIILI